MVLTVGAQPDFADVGIPSCGTSQNVTGRVDNLRSVDKFQSVKLYLYFRLGMVGKIILQMANRLMVFDGRMAVHCFKPMPARLNDLPRIH